MKIIILKNSILLIRLNLNKDIAKSYFIFFASWFNVKIEKLSFDLEALNLNGIIKLHKNLSIEYSSKYRI